jgi:hypothetical protein
MLKLSKLSRNKTTKFDPHLLSKNIITGITTKKKKKHNTVKKKEILVGTVGLPIFFSSYLYDSQRAKQLPFTISIGDDTRKKMGKKKRKK